MGDGRAEGLSAMGGGGQAAISPMPDGGTHVRMFESLQLGGPFVGGLLSLIVQSLGHVQLFMTPWTLALGTPGFPVLVIR